ISLGPDNSIVNGSHRTGPLRLPAGTYWASATGRVLGQTGFSHGTHVIAFEAGIMKMSDVHKNGWYIVPGPDDRHVYVCGEGITSTEGGRPPDIAFTFDPDGIH